MTGAEARALEAAIAAEAALLSPTTGITDYAAIARHMAARFQAEGGTLWLGAALRGGHETEAGVELETSVGPVSAGKAVICAGLMADRVLRAMGVRLPFASYRSGVNISAS